VPRGEAAPKAKPSPAAVEAAGMTKPKDGYVPFNGQRLAYAEYGEGERVLVLVHGLLMNRHMYDHLAPEIASRGFRVITVDLLGHGASDMPTDMRAYNMSTFADQLAAVIDELGLDRPVVGGTSLGANVSLEMATRHPKAARALFIEMPVLDNALVAAGLIFLPILLALRIGRPVLGFVSMLAKRIPRTNYLVDILLDWMRRNPTASQAVLEGILFGRTAPPREERELIGLPTLVIGHPADPLHPFSDSDMLVDELPRARLVNAESIFEWRVSPKRLDDELAAFLAEVYADEPAVEAV
jgi:pimeloyl-ACP methyl ester carboxylesterase